MVCLLFIDSSIFAAAHVALNQIFLGMMPFMVYKGG
jgi:TRAP-type mannitol/chloroaromatic compound transport system permease large subunit